jgi:hypothetical protein
MWVILNESLAPHFTKSEICIGYYYVPQVHSLLFKKKGKSDYLKHKWCPCIHQHGEQVTIISENIGSFNFIIILDLRPISAEHTQNFFQSWCYCLISEQYNISYKTIQWTLRIPHFCFKMIQWFQRCWKHLPQKDIF